MIPYEMNKQYKCLVIFVTEFLKSMNSNPEVKDDKRNCIELLYKPSTVLEYVHKHPTAHGGVNFKDNDTKFLAFLY